MCVCVCVNALGRNWVLWDVNVLGGELGAILVKA